MTVKKIIIKLKFLFLTTILLALSSCASRTDIIYFQDEGLGDFNQPVINPEIKYQPDDMLTINVSGLDPDAVRPFNLWSIA
ncbi:MAG: polysaccharide export protein, partial [Flavobacteriaceae bacterium]|nr:polysaccharide export protein [Bacteroidia bacterium]NNL60760.1 polysaccharide export protein [Flavobacteriaceae bacterium]